MKDIEVGLLAEIIKSTISCIKTLEKSINSVPTNQCDKIWQYF